MGLFRRKGRDREGNGDSPGDRVGGTSGTPPGSGASVGPPAPAPPDGAPPPLPRRGPADAGAMPTERFSRCFVCGSLLDGGRCPQCRIAWVE